MEDKVFSKEQDGEFFLKELQTNNGNKKKTSTHYELD
jgi:hypothetical protein